MVRISIDEILQPRPEKSEFGGGCGSCGSGDSTERCGNGLEKIYPTSAVRFGYLKYIGEFSYAPNMRFTCGAKVVVQTRRGMEIGEQVSLTCNGCSKSVTRDQIKQYIEASGGDSYTYAFDAGRIIREATMGDLAENARLQSLMPSRRRLAQEWANQHELDIKILDCEILFGGERVIFYFRSEARVDFRDLVRSLTRELQTRVEMRHVGVRDEARLLADYETCGRECCCKVFLKTLKKVNMKMAKLQKQTIDPTKVSGRCGRLKCCLRYEHETYEELAAKLPKIGARICTNHGDGIVTHLQVLTQLVQLRTDDNKIVTVVEEDILRDESGRPLLRRVTAPGDVNAGEAVRSRPATGFSGRRPPSEAGRADPDRPKADAPPLEGRSQRDETGVGQAPQRAEGPAETRPPRPGEGNFRTGRGRRRKPRIRVIRKGGEEPSALLPGSPADPPTAPNASTPPQQGNEGATEGAFESGVSGVGNRPPVEPPGERKGQPDPLHRKRPRIRRLRPRDRGMDRPNDSSTREPEAPGHFPKESPEP